MNLQGHRQALIGLFETNPQEKGSAKLPMKVARTVNKAVNKAHGPVEVRQGYLIRAADWLPEDDTLRAQSERSGSISLRYFA